MPPRKNVIGAVFDVQPIDESGNFDFQRFENINQTVNLRISDTPAIPKPTHKKSHYHPDEVLLVSQVTPNTPKDIKPQVNIPPTPQPKQEEVKTPELPVVQETKQNLLGELEDIFSSPLNVQTELVRFGGQIHDLDLRRQRQKVYQRPSESEEVLKHSSAYVRSSVERGSTEASRPNVKPQAVNPLPQIELVVANNQIPVYKYEHIMNRFDNQKLSKMTQEFWQKKHIPNRKPLFKKFTFNRGSFSSKWMTIMIITPVIAIGASFLLFNTGTSVKNNVVQNGKNAVANMMDAKQSMEELRFSDAANSFNLAHDDFIKANNTLDKIGASFSWLLKYIPGINAITSASNLVIAGQNVAKVGEDFSAVLSDASRIKLNTILTPGAGPSLHDLFQNLRTVSEASKIRIDNTKGLLANINANVLPEDKRGLFDLFKYKLPQLSDILDKSVTYSQMLATMIPERGPKKYLILFQNNSELRATGGFPGSYAVISFDDGRYSGIKIDDIYNPDGQLKNNIIPPKPLQHITWTWSARDANWFADFPTSAKKIIEFYKLGSGESVDGVLTITPDIIIDILKITGPIDLPEYGIVLSADNFMSEVQAEVEYSQHEPGDTPKKILIDFFPRFLARLGADQKSLFTIAQIFSDAIKNKHILAYFNDSNAEQIALENNFAGVVDQSANDYLQVVFTNVKGSKTDAVTDSSFKLATQINDNDSVEHELIITRKHNGGDFDLRFYNLQNPDYVRVYVPENAELGSIDGNDIPNFKPLLNYSIDKYKDDPDLKKMESETTHPQDGVDVFYESGRKVFGFWLIVDPKQTKSVTVKYKLADAYKKGDYRILIQKQPGTDATPLEAGFNIPSNKDIRNFSKDLQVDGNSLILKSDLSIDRDLEIKLR